MAIGLQVSLGSGLSRKIHQMIIGIKSAPTSWKLCSVELSELTMGFLPELKCQLQMQNLAGG